jgi:N-acetyl sugar amidotransferase
MSSNLEAFYGLPNEVVFCKRCVISNQRPSSAIEFKSKKDDEKSYIGFQDGICSACTFNETKNQKINWKDREDRLVALLDKFRNNGRGYNVIVPGSGGKDSVYASHMLKYRYGMNPLTVTWAPHLYTDVGWQNFSNWIHVGGLDNILFTPNGKLHRLLTRLAFLNLLHPFQPFIIGQRIIGPAIAAKFGVPLVFYGENQAEYGNNIEENKSPTMDPSFFSVTNPEKMLFGGVPMEEICSKFGFTHNDFAPYIPPRPDDVSFANIEVHYLGYYLKWDPQECYYYAVENTAFQANPNRTEGSYSKYSSIDDKIDPFHYYTTLVKFGIGRATYDAAQEIRNGKITREEGVGLVRKFDQEFPQKYFPDFLNYVGITELEFFDVINKFRSPHLWERVGTEWKLRHQVV